MPVRLQYYKVLVQYYFVLLRTTKYYSSTTKYYSSTSPVLLCTTKHQHQHQQHQHQHQRQHRHQRQHQQHQHHQRHQNVDFTTVSRDRHVRSYERVALSTARSQFYYSFARSTRTILRKGSSSSGKIAILLQFRAIDTYDLTKEFIGQVKNRQITTVSRDGHVRSYERVARAPARSQFYYSFARWTRTILRKGCSGSGRIAILLQVRAIDTHDLTRGLHFRKHFPDHGGPPPQVIT